MDDANIARIRAALSEVEHRVEVASGLHHDASTWQSSETAYDGYPCLWDWIFSVVKNLED